MHNFIIFAIFSEIDEIDDFHFLSENRKFAVPRQSTANFVAMNEFFAKNLFFLASELSLNTLSRARERI